MDQPQNPNRDQADGTREPQMPRQPDQSGPRRSQDQDESGGNRGRGNGRGNQGNPSQGTEDIPEGGRGPQRERNAASGSGTPNRDLDRDEDWTIHADRGVNQSER